MDELEISGKRYISTRRAAKEHKYHSDYIGQLIRNKKVEGQKVGRAWYVVESSLSAYLAKEPSARDQAPAEAKPVVQRPVARVDEVAVPEVVEEVIEQEPVVYHQPATAKFRKVVEPIIIEEEEVVQEIFHEPAPEPVHDSAEYHIPLKISQRPQPGGLRYIADDEPLFPAIKKNRETHFSHVHVMPPLVPVMSRYEEEKVVIRPTAETKQKKSNILIKTGTLFIVGAAIFVITSLVSIHLNSTAEVSDGQAASAGYSLQ